MDVVLDKWDLREGHDANAFMEKMVTDPEIKKVLLICDRLYSEKADGRSGGVGTETQIISAEVYSKTDQNKFVAVVVERDTVGKPYLPAYYRSRIYIDFSDSEIYAVNFEQLLRWIYDKPLYVKPELGSKPAFLVDNPSISLPTGVPFRRVLDAIRSGKDYATGALNEYFDTFVQNLEAFRIKDDGSTEFDDKVIESIEKFTPYRNQVIEILISLAQYRDTKETHQQVHRFFEGLFPYLYCLQDTRSYREWDFDNFRFTVHEVFLYAIAIFLRYERFTAAAYLLRNQYFLEKNGTEKMVSFSDFREQMRSLDHRNQRLELRRISLRSDMLHARSAGTGVKASHLMQADFVVFVRDCLDVLREDGYQKWWPETLLYIERHGGPVEIFGRSQSAEYFEGVRCLFDIGGKADLEPLLKAYADRKLRVPSWDRTSFDAAILLGYEKLATRP